MSDLVLFLFGLVVGIVLVYWLLRSAMDARYQGELERWKVEEEDGFRRDAVARSRAVLKGKIGEQLAPLLMEFPYAPSDARFLGNPIDFVVFDGYTEMKERDADALRRIVFVEVKKGPASSLSREERRVRDCILDGRVEWAEVRLLDEAPAKRSLTIR
jgi:predicted Holliday junction resolvase-like endonuclease